MLVPEHKAMAVLSYLVPRIPCVCNKCVVSGPWLSKEQSHARVSLHNVILYENKAMDLVLLTRFSTGVNQGSGQRRASNSRGGAESHRFASDRVRQGEEGLGRKDKRKSPVSSESPSALDA